jgi:hypothetical protein
MTTESDDNTLGSKERPILFSGPMVRAILDGRKTKTRRIVKPQPERQPGMCHYSPTGWAETDANGGCLCHRVVRGGFWPGQRLWVRETFDCDHCEYPHGDVAEMRTMLDYRATHDCTTWEAGCPCNDENGRSSWRPSIYMPRWASRITLEVTGVRVERLQDISEADAMAEGVGGRAQEDAYSSCRDEFAALWDSINGKRAPWESNPWVWVVEVTRCEGEA